MVRAGQNTRMYPWVSGRIIWEISALKAMLLETPNDETRVRLFNARLKYLQNVKLLIDAPR